MSNIPLPRLQSVHAGCFAVRLALVWPGRQRRRISSHSSSCRRWPNCGLLPVLFRLPLSLSGFLSLVASPAKGQTHLEKAQQISGQLPLPNAQGTLQQNKRLMPCHIGRLQRLHDHEIRRCSCQLSRVHTPLGEVTQAEIRLGYGPS